MAIVRRTGRPTKSPEAGKRVSLGLKVTPDVKAKVDKAARARGNTQSQEAEFRLNRSFADDDAFSSEKMRFWAYMMAETFSAAGSFEAKMQDDEKLWTDAEWLADPSIYLTAMFSVIRKLIRDMPSPKRDDVQLVLAQVAAHFQRLEGELLGTNTLVSGFAEPKGRPYGKR